MASHPRLFVKTSKGIWPADPATIDWYEGLVEGEVFSASVTRPRHYKRHQRFFVMLQVAYDLWQPEAIEFPAGSSTFIVPKKSMERFREWVVIKSGFYEVFGLPSGGVRVAAQSMSFDSMDQEQFEELYSNAIDVLLKLPTMTMGREAYEEAINNIIQFA